MSDPLTAADPLAERRYAYAQAAARDRDWSAAADVLEQTLEIDPRWAAAWFALGEARQQLGDFAAAASHFRETLRLDPADRQGASLRLAALEGRRPARLPAAYVARLFDDYAPRFERHLKTDLAYRGPEILRDAVTSAAPGARFARVIDLGCGSGLAGAAFRPLADTLVGVDLSPAMIEESRRARLYDELVVGDVSSVLLASADANLILAADVFVYLGDLTPVFAAAAEALSPGGFLAFTVEALDDGDFALAETLRFKHSKSHLTSALAAAGLDVESLEPASTRKEAGGDVAGWVVVAKKRDFASFGRARQT